MHVFRNHLKERTPSEEKHNYQNEHLNRKQNDLDHFIVVQLV